jgi:hypothetical protein
MTSQLDLILLPLIGYAEQEVSTFPGLFTTKPPRRPARGRKQDHLVLYLTQSGNAPLSDEQVNQILTRLAQTYYKTPGSVTAGQRAVADALNQYLLDRNLRNTSSGQQTTGLLTQMIMREGRLWLAQSGPTHVFIVTSEQTEHLYDPVLAGRGLGLSRTAPVRYSQVVLNINDALVLTPQPPPNWTSTTLKNATSQGAGNLRRHLLSQAAPHLNAVLAQAQNGNQKVHVLRPVRAQRPRGLMSQEAEASSRPAAVQPETPEIKLPSLREESEHQQAEPPKRAAVPQTSRPDQRIPPVQSENQSGKMPDRSGPSVERIATPPAKSRRLRMPKINLGPITTALGMIWRAFANTGRQVSMGVGTLLGRMLPDSGIFSLPSSTMAFVAIAIPIVVVAIASFVYFQSGRAAQHEAYLTQAIQAAERAGSLEDPQDLRLAWDLTLRYIDQAEFYKTTEQSRELRNQAQTALDSLNYVERLDYQNALASPLSADARISRILSMDNDLYLLNGSDGVVLRATLTSKGYALDQTFQCGPGPFGGYIVGAIIDIAPLPRSNNENATVLGIDANGNLLYCIPDEAPLALPMAPPDTNWGAPKGVSQDSGDLYILDPLTNAVWIYRGSNVTQQPRLFFSEQIPTMHDVIDLAVNRNDLYLLHEDGQMSTCTYSGLVESPTRCEDPALYSDPRPGMQEGPKLQDAQFSEILFIPPPDPSLFLLDPESKAVYHLSVRLTLQRQFQSSTPLPEGPATAFTINRANRTAFLALGNQVYYASMP